MQRPKRIGNTRRWVASFYLMLVLIFSLAVKAEAQAAMLLLSGDESPSLSSSEEIGLWIGERRTIVAGARTLPTQEQEIEWQSNVFDRTVFLFERGSPQAVRWSAAGAVDLGRVSPMQPISSSPSSAMLFVPAVLGLLGVSLRERSSSTRSADKNGAIPEERSARVPQCILLLSPDLAFTNEVRGALDRVGYAVHVVLTINEAMALSEHQLPAIVLVDRRVSDWDMLRTHPALTHTLIMMLIPVGSVYAEEHGISDLERGADGIYDFRDGQRLFTAKVGAYLRRAGYDTTRRGLYQVGAVELDADIHEVKIAGHCLQLSAKPFAILKALMQAPSKVFSRSELVDRVWGPGFAIGAHTLDVHVHALRQQLDHDPTRRCELVTVKGVGFKLRAVDSRPPSFAVGIDRSTRICDANESEASVAGVGVGRDRVNPLCQLPSPQVPVLKRTARRSLRRTRRRPTVVGHFGRAVLAS